MVRSRSVYGPFMVRLWSVRGPFAVRLWSVHGPFMVRLWSVYGPFMVRLWSVHGPFAVRSRFVYGLRQGRHCTYGLRIYFPIFGGAFEVDFWSAFVGSLLSRVRGVMLLILVPNRE